MKIAHIVGARPQFIKYAPVFEAIKKINSRRGKKIIDILIHTGQHYDYLMSKVFFDQFKIKRPDFHLGVGSGPHSEQTGKIIQRAEKIFSKQRPDFVVVYGDTNSTLGGALAAAKLDIPIAHIEAGLRSYNRAMPEETNRVLTDHLSTMLFCPSDVAVKNLANEGIKNVHKKRLLRSPCGIDKKSVISPDVPAVINSGDVMYDVMLGALKLIRSKASAYDELGLKLKGYLLLTLHRAENTDNVKRYRAIVDFVKKTAAGRDVVFPMHPRTQKVHSLIKKIFPENIKIIKPVGYYDMLALQKRASMIMTDSGGVQKEAYWLKVPCITLREETEWTETVASGWNILYKNYKGYHKPKTRLNLCYGDGRAAEKIVAAVANILGNK